MTFKDDTNRKMVEDGLERCRYAPERKGIKVSSV